MTGSGIVEEVLVLDVPVVDTKTLEVLAGGNDLLEDR